MKLAIVILGLMLINVSCHDNSKGTYSKTDLTKSQGINRTLESTSNTKIHFALIFSIQDSIYFLGKLGLNEDITIMDNENGKLFDAKTINYFKYEDGLGDTLLLTRISKQLIRNDNKFLIAMFDNIPID